MPIDYSKPNPKVGRTLKRRCAKCGRIGYYKPRMRGCRFQNFGPRSYWCFGFLEPVERKKKPEAAAAATTLCSCYGHRDCPHGSEAQLTKEQIGERLANGGLLCPCGYVNSGHQGKTCGRCGNEIQLRAKRPQDEAARKAATAKKKVRELARKIERATKLLKAWQRKEAHFSKRAAMTDAELEAERSKRSAALKAGKAAREAARLGRGIAFEEPGR